MAQTSLSVLSIAAIEIDDGKIPSPEELWKIIQQQQAEIEELKATLGARGGQAPATSSISPGAVAQPDQERLEEMEQRIAATEQGLEATAAAVTALLDRLLHHAHVLKCGPRSWRTKVQTDLRSEDLTK